jgi:AraC-like DNA-binding protein
MSATREQAVSPWLCIGRGWASYVGPVQQNRPHRHHLIQIAWSASAPFELAGGGYKRQAVGHVVDAGASHCVHANEPVRLLFLDPAMSAAGRWRVHAGGKVSQLTSTQVAALEGRFQQWLITGRSAAADAVSSASREHAIRQWLVANLDQPLRAVQAARTVGLSEGRFLHWFSQTHAMPFRAHVRWLRLQRALRSLAEGCNLTAAAHAAGFADSAHLSRTFVASFGMGPSGLQRVRIDLSPSPGPDLDGVMPGLEGDDT